MIIPTFYYLGWLLRLLLLFILIVSTSTNTLAKTATGEKNRFLIVPGKSISSFRVGVGEDEFAVLGEGKGGQTQGRKQYTYWPPESKPLSPVAPYFAEYTVRDDNGHWLVTTIRVTSHQYATAQGISTHSTFAEIKRAFPHLKLTSEDTTEKGLNTAV